MRSLKLLLKRITFQVTDLGSRQQRNGDDLLMVKNVSFESNWLSKIRGFGVREASLHRGSVCASHPAVLGLILTSADGEKFRPKNIS